VNFFFLNANVTLTSDKEIKKDELVKEFKIKADELAIPYNKENENKAVFEEEDFGVNLVDITPDPVTTGPVTTGPVTTTSKSVAATIFIKSSTLMFTFFSTFLAYNL